MSASKLAKAFSRKLKVTWREQPTRYDIEALHENIRRVGVVIRVRWTLVAVLIGYSLVAGFAYTARVPAADLARLMFIPALALMLVIAYNTFYQLTYRRFGNFAVFNHVQLFLDSVVVTVLVYYSGGIQSWFYAMFSLFVLEAAFILPKRRDAWIVALYCIAFLGMVMLAEYAGLLPHIVIPFSAGGVQKDAIYLSVRYLWQITVLLGTAAVATLLVASSSAQAAGQPATIVDAATGLHSRAYFKLMLSSESARAQRDRRQLHLLLVDLDQFGEYNKRFGIDQGDLLLKEIAKTLKSVVADTGAIGGSTNIVSRHGGEEFAVLFVDVDDGAAPTREDAIALAWRICRGIADTRVDDTGVTASVGIATLPDEGDDADSLLAAADDALARAALAGGNCAGLGPALPRDDADGMLIELDDMTEV